MTTATTAVVVATAAAAVCAVREALVQQAHTDSRSN